MRCKNCGWPNKPNETTCVKCGSPLDTDPQEMNSIEDNNGFQSNQVANNSDGLKRTVMEVAAFGPSVDQTDPETPTVAETTCPKCGYPMRSDSTKCPNCNYSSNSYQPNNSSTEKGAYKRRPTRLEQELEEEPALKQTRKANAGGGKFNGTINPYMMSYQEEPIFMLQPIQRINERKPVEAVEMEGSEVTLNRDNTEPGNPTISSKEQAMISHIDGHWFIEDLSEQKTTFVQASHKTELHNGDIILLGNRLFEFKEQ